jgi:hypothetical protein
MWQKNFQLNLSARRATKLLRLRPSKATVAHALKGHDTVARTHFYNWFLQCVNDEVDTPLVFFPNKTWLSTRGEVNS